MSEIVKNLSVTLQNHVGVTCRRCRELSLKSLVAILVTCRVPTRSDALLAHGMSRAVYTQSVIQSLASGLYKNNIAAAKARNVSPLAPA
jgi:hypothetical protein